ncbi:MAG: hypothetical protein E7488_01750 [Ruminococcaceae bacterium]|nr:hypothetical protein [Oscillospiraceae bacterium]
MIFVTADTHGEVERFDDKQLKKIKKGDTLVILGDFGFVWNDSEKEKKALARLAKKPYTILFIDGLGDSFEVLAKYPETVYCGAKSREIVKDKIYYICRGEVAEIENRKLLCFGGNDIYDPDIVESFDDPAAADFENCGANLEKHGNSVDYILTHIPSGRINRFINLDSHATSETMDFFDLVAKDVDYKKWYFGCLHLDKYISPKVQAVYLDVHALWQEEKKGFFSRNKG